MAAVVESARLILSRCRARPGANNPLVLTHVLVHVLIGKVIEDRLTPRAWNTRWGPRWIHVPDITAAIAFGDVCRFGLRVPIHI